MKPFSLLVPGVFLALDLQLSTLSAGQIDVAGPAGSRAFGIGVAVLPNGNFVVIDQNYDLPNALDVGAVYLYDGGTLGLISTLTGSTAGDEVGSAGITVLGNGNFVVRSPLWHNGGTPLAGAVTWGSATSGVAGVVSPANSLVGSANNDQSNGAIVVLNNGNYVVTTMNWDNGPIANAGAVTWGNGTSGTTGVISSANSLVGSTANEQVGTEVIALKNGNYVVRSSAWDNGPTANVGAVTWGNGTSGVTGVITSVNSLVGSTVNDSVGSGSVTALENGSYVVRSPNWDNGLLTNAGAITWSSGTVGRTGTVSSANSLVGITLNDQASALIVALNNGNYVMGFPNWDNGVATNAGAVTWGNGTTGTTGIISSANSLIGTTVNDVLGGLITALADGNYVVSSSGWDSGSVSNAGAVTWGNGTSGVTGVVSSAISLIGTVANDFVGFSGVTALSNGMYVAISPLWDNGAVTEAGAVTWCSAGGRTGAVSAANSLVGSVGSNQVGSAGIVVLNNGNYVVRSPLWESGAVTNIGAVTWCNGTSGRTGVVSAVNSLIGSSANDSIGNGGVTALNNGNYVVNSFSWRSSGLANAGAVTWGNGTSGVTGVVSSANSLVGSTTNDFVGSPISIALNNGNYVVSSPSWDNGPVANVGAVTWCNGTTGRIGVISPATSLVGSKVQDQVGDFGITAVSNGNYVVYSGNWDYGSVLNSGAITLGNGALGTTGEVSGATSILGIAEFPTMGVGALMTVTYDNFNARVVVGRFKDNRVSLLGYLPEIVVERPPNVNVADGATVIFGAPQGTNSSLLFTIKNINVEQLTGLSIAIDGSDAASFTVTASPAATVGPLGGTTFTVKFSPATTGTKTAALHITSNDTDENPFDINLSGQVLTSVLDTDGDGLSDTTEFYLSALGFDWQVSQPDLINALFGNANGAGLYTMNQLQALNVNSPLLQKNPTNGLFTLTIGVRKSTDLINFSPFPMTAPQTTINGQGALEFQFSSTNNAAFFRLESK